MAATVASAYNAAAHGAQSSMTAEVKPCASSSKPSSSRSTQRSEQQDRFYGYREPSELCERFILYLFACPLDSTSASASLPATSNGTPAPRLSEFIAYALYRTRLPEAVTYQALYLLLRLKIRFPAARGSSGHRLFISALMIASKSSCDDTYSNKSWAIVGQGLFSLREINQMERELFGYLGYKVNVSAEDLEMFTYELEQDVDGGRIDLVVRKILELMSRRSSVDMGSSDAPRERSESVSSVKSSAPPTPALDSSSGFSSPSIDSHAGPQRVSSGRRSRQSSVSHSFSQRASISGYTAASASTAGHIVASTSMPASTPMVKSASHRQERSATAPSFIHPFINSARERCRPYTTPVHSLPLSSSSSASASAAAAAAGYYSNSPAASISSSSMCSSIYAHSSAMSATPSPYASRSIMSGRTTPDTPPSELDSAQWEESRYYGLDSKIELSPTSTVAYKLPHQQSVNGFGQHASAADSYLHPYNHWRS